MSEDLSSYMHKIAKGDKKSFRFIAGKPASVIKPAKDLYLFENTLWHSQNHK